MRRVRPSDGVGLVDLWRETWTDTYGSSLDSVALDGMLRGLAEGVGSMLPGTGERSYCLEVASTIVGSAIVAERGRTAYLWGMYVLPSHQRSGAGARLLAAVAAGLEGVEVLEVRVLPSSGRAQSFYRKHGFRPAREEITAIMSGPPLLTTVLTADVACLRKVSPGVG